MVGAKILIFILAVLSQSHAEFQDNCTTPDGRNGVCKSIRSCKRLKLCRRRPPTPAIHDFLQNSYCGTAPDGRPAVCCETRYRPTITSITSNPCYPEVLISRVSNRFFPRDCGQPTRTIKMSTIRTLPDELPWVVVFEYDTPKGPKSDCVGSLISDRHVMTAAHCVSPSGAKLRSVRLGEYNKTENPDCVPDGETTTYCLPPVVSIPVEKILVHKNWDANKKNQDSDIALVKLARPVVFSATARPICLPGTTDVNEGLIVTGWGDATEENPASDVKLQGRLTLLPPEKCNLSNRTDMHGLTAQNYICVRGDNDEFDRRSVGAPLMGPAINILGKMRWTAFGVVSSRSVYSTNSTESLAAYTKVNAYIYWIRAAMNSMN